MARTLKTLSASLGLALLTCTTPSVIAQDAQPVVAVKLGVAKSRAKALAVVDRFIEAIGGAERLREKRSIRMTGVVKMMGMEGSMVVLMIPDGPFIQKMSFPAMGLESISGSDGTRGWTFNSMTGAELMPEAMHDQLKRESDQSSLLRFDETYETIEYVGEGEYEGTAVETIRVVDRAGLESVQHFSKESGLMIGSESDQDSPQGRMRVSSVINEYKEFNGLKLATHTAVNAGAIAMEMTIAEVVTGDVKAEEVAPPKAVAKLLARAAAKEAEKAAKANDNSEEDSEG